LRLKIGLLGYEDPAHIRSYSGTPYHILHFLRKAGHDVRVCGPYPLRYTFPLRAANRILIKTTGRHIVHERHPLLASQYGAVVDAYAQQHPDLDLFLATSFFYASRKRSKIPIFAWGDTTVAGVLNLYPYYKNISEWMIRQSHNVEQHGLDACAQVIFSSQWAADVALSHYRLDAQKTHVITYGANLKEHPDHRQIDEILRTRRVAEKTIVLVGVDWQRKGVDTAIEIVGALCTMGVNAKLQVIGCNAPAGVMVPEYVEVLGRVAKERITGKKNYFDYLREAHAFLLPTRAECASVSIAEANAYALPVVVSDVGGNASLMSNGVNGYLQRLDEPAARWAEDLRSILDGSHSYEEQCLRAYQYYEQELSWERAIARFTDLASEFLKKGK